MQWAAGAAVALVVVAGLWLLLVPPGPSGSRGKEKATQGSQQRDPSASSRRPNRRGPPSAAPVVPAGPSRLVKAILEAGTSDDPPADDKSWSGNLAAARLAMSERRLPDARRHVESALKLAASPAEQAEARRVQALFTSLYAFWVAVWEEASLLRTAREATIGGKVVMISESSPGFLAVREEGKMLLMNLQTMPQSWAVALAEKRMHRTGENTDLCVGSFLAVDAQGDRQQARARWEKAGEAGQELIGELDAPPPAPPPEGTAPS